MSVFERKAVNIEPEESVVAPNMSLIEQYSGGKTAAEPYMPPTDLPQTELPALPIFDEAAGQNGDGLGLGDIRFSAGETFVKREKRQIISSVAKVALNGLKRASELAASIGSQATGNPINTEDLRTSLLAAKDMAQERYDSVKNLAWGEEHKEARRKVIKVGAAVGALAVAAVGAYYLEQKGASGVHNSAQEAVTNHPAKSYSAVPNEFKISLPLPVQAVAAQAGHHANQVAKHVGYHLEHLKYYGDTISYHAEAKLQSVLGHKPSAAELNDYVKRTLKFNHMNWEKAKEMFRGQSFKLPFVRR